MKGFFIWYFVKNAYFVNVHPDTGVITFPTCPHEATVFTNKKTAERILKQVQRDVYQWAAMHECETNSPFIVRG